MAFDATNVWIVPKPQDGLHSLIRVEPMSDLDHSTVRGSLFAVSQLELGRIQADDHDSREVNDQIYYRSHSPALRLDEYRLDGRGIGATIYCAHAANISMNTRGYGLWSAENTDSGRSTLASRMWRGLIKLGIAENVDSTEVDRYHSAYAYFSDGDDLGDDWTVDGDQDVNVDIRATREESIEILSGDSALDTGLSLGASNFELFSELITRVDFRPLPFEVRALEGRYGREAVEEFRTFDIVEIAEFLSYVNAQWGADLATRILLRRDVFSMLSENGLDPREMYGIVDVGSGLDGLGDQAGRVMQFKPQPLPPPSEQFKKWQRWASTFPG